MSTTYLLFLLSWLYCLHIVYAFDKEECKLEKKYSKLVASQKATHECSSDILSSFPDHDSFAFILDQRILKTQKILRRINKKEGKPKANTCYQQENGVQFNVATYNDKDTVIIYFYGTEGDMDFTTDMTVKLAPYYLPDILSRDIKEKHPKTWDDFESETHHIRLHMGISWRLYHDSFLQILREKLMGIYFDKNDFSKIKKPRKLVIGGRSLGAAYATLFYLNLIGDRYTSKITGISILPTKLDDITVIPIGSPMVIYHADVHKISAAVQDRIFNIITYRDPVVLMSSGKRSEDQLPVISTNIKEFAYKFARDEKLVRLGTNGPIGRYIMFMQAKHIGYIGKKFGGGKSENIVVKVLDKNEFYLNYGADCLWKNTKGGVLGIHLWPLYHRKKPYLQHIMNSCIYLYLEKSQYWRALQMKYKHAVKKKIIIEHKVYRGSKKENKPIYYNWEDKSWA